MSPLGTLFKGPPGHPLHPPLTDVTIGALTLAAGLAVVGYIGWIPDAAGKGMWLALAGGLAAATVTAVTGYVDWYTVTFGTPLWRTVTIHMLTMVTAVALFGLAAWQQYPGLANGGVATSALALTLAGWVTLAFGGWLGGTVTFVHGMRVLNLVDEPTAAAIGADAEQPTSRERREERTARPASEQGRRRG